MSYLPVMLDLRGRRALVVGGGEMAAAKIAKLLEAAADVTVVAEALADAVRTEVTDGRVHWVQRAFAEGDCEGFAVVVAAEETGAPNGRIAADATRFGALVNAADDAAHSDFILPAVATRGDVTIASSTNGASPAFARWLRARLETFLDSGPAELGALAAEARERARKRERACADGCTRTATPPPLTCDGCPNHVPAERWQSALDDAFDALEREGSEGARHVLAEALGLDAPLAPRIS